MSASSDASLVGTWKLLSREDMTCDGQRRIDPVLGRHPIAYLMYDAAGNFSAQFMKRDRSSVAHAAGGSNNSAAMNGYDAYFGRYTVEEDAVVIQELLGALSPADVGRVVTRRFRINGSELIIELDTTNNGEPTTRTLRWQRVA